MQTTGCVACPREARFWTGHVMHDKRMISAGWCSDECRESLRSYKGFFGGWSPRMGASHKGKRATAAACDCGEGCAVWRLDHPSRSGAGRSG